MADLTVTRLGRRPVPGGRQRRHPPPGRRHDPPRDARRREVAVTDVTAGTTLLSVQGPRSRELLQRLTPGDWSDDAFPYLTAREVELGYARVLRAAGDLRRRARLRAARARPSTALRLRRAARGRRRPRPPAGRAAGDGHAAAGEGATATTASTSRTPTTRSSAGLAFTVAWDKPGGFVGRDALLATRGDPDRGRRGWCSCSEDPGAVLFGGEPVLLDGSWVGYVRAGAYGHTLGGAVGLAVVENADGVTPQWLAAPTRFDAGLRRAARPGHRVAAPHVRPGAPPHPVRRPCAVSCQTEPVARLGDHERSTCPDVPVACTSLHDRQREKSAVH